MMVVQVFLLNIFFITLLFIVHFVNLDHISTELLQPSNEWTVAFDTRASFDIDCANVLVWRTSDCAQQRWLWSASCEWPRAASSDVSTTSRQQTLTSTILLISVLRCCRMVKSFKLRKVSLCSLDKLSRRSSNRGFVRKAKVCAGEKIVLMQWQIIAYILCLRSLGRSTLTSFDMISIGSWHIVVRIQFRRLAASRTMRLFDAFSKKNKLLDNELYNREFFHQIHAQIVQRMRHRPARHNVYDLLALNVCDALQGQADHDELLQVAHNFNHNVLVL
ncbi:hypothetical protein Mp_4g18980 [Marchantia polymorpha subsp. ruderalis]|uniref:Uncharacterized protein n=2 Tax=Marchantia polymorpha TaxID=3197 RepID=A0AAF6BBF5_MARPO|nr:hypothetical protein MARPO_0164s0012 [Marchantia polymorpha]BBN09339.1 hypothetical protein Mp_4g18980 [Marchantia polymorpha subsp. ruderalis]|eukprot:PTQ28416.1 hypothetical protein MARPO_0164s0012 [Marchantia polymorpha]